MNVNPINTAFTEAKDNMITACQSKAREVDPEDWREMTDETWDKLVSGFDEYIEACSEELQKKQELQDEAARKAAAMAPADMKSIMAALAALKAAANGFFETLPETENDGEK